MITLTLPDGATRQFDEPLNGIAFAESISKSLAKKALALKINGEPVDLATVIDSDCEIAVLTASDEEGVDLMRHDCAHVLAEAVCEERRTGIARCTHVSPVRSRRRVPVWCTGRQAVCSEAHAAYMAYVAYSTVL